jgi:hypothetical protein
MQAACCRCGTKHVLKDADLGIHPKVQFRCSKCGAPTIVETQRRPDATIAMSPLPAFARDDSTRSLTLLHHDEDATLPPLIAVALTIVSGPGKGSVHKFKKPRVIIGRDVADIALPDPEVSRHHCLLEVRDAHISLRDLDSTNGTFFGDERVRAAILHDGAEFRIGETILRVGFEPA